MKAKDLDRKFDAGQDVTQYLDMAQARRPNQEQKRVNVDFPLWMIHFLDKEAKRLGVPRQSIIKVWLAERLERGMQPRRSARRAKEETLKKLLDRVPDCAPLSGDER